MGACSGQSRTCSTHCRARAAASSNPACWRADMQAAGCSAGARPAGSTSSRHPWHAAAGTSGSRPRRRVQRATGAASMPKPAARLHVYVSGLVQGVFFRDYTQDKARQLRLSGFVRNRLDGRVEVVAEGDEPELQQLLAWLHTGSPAADVSGVQAEWGAATGEFCGFDRLWTA